MRIVTIACRQDNYAYLVICEKTMLCAVVDPSESAPVVAEIAKQAVEVVAIWNTHHHYDHVDGNKAILELFPDAAVVAHESDKGRVPGQTVFAEAGQDVTVGVEIKASILFNPGHTSGAISYHLCEHQALFTGDTLFAAGCGRVFEGTPEQMHESLRRLVSLPSETKVYCGHEYSVANLRFAATVEPGNASIGQRAERVAALRSAGESSMGFELSEELATNVFVRTSEAEVSASALRHGGTSDENPVAIFAALRRWKDSF